MITESCVLTTTGAVAGLLMAQLLVRAGTLASPVQFPSFVQPGINLKVLMFTVGVALLAGLVLGLAPAMHARFARLTEALKESSRGGSGGARAQRLRSVLIVTEVALAIVLFIGAGLMIRSSQKLAAVDPGFDTSNLLTVSVSVPRQPAPPGATPPVPGQPAPPPLPYLVSGAGLMDRVRSVPGVTSVGLTSDVPLTGAGSAVFYTAEGDATTDAQTVPRAYVHRVSPGFFETIHMPLRGRTFRSDELKTDSTVVVVSEGLVARFWPNQDPVGKRIKLGNSSSTNPWLTIIGTVPETKYRSLPANPTADPDLYFPAVDRSPQPMLIRTSVPPLSVLPSVRAAIRQDQPAVAIFAANTLEELVAQNTSASRFTMWVLSLFAGTALLLSVIGIYGVMSYLVTQRMREFGIRLALGASRRDIVSVVLRQGTILIAIGAALGIAVTIGLSQLFTTLLFEVTVGDLSAALATGVLLVAAVLACVIPAVRATRVNPVETLRSQ
jgi:predicted permease